MNKYTLISTENDKNSVNYDHKKKLSNNWEFLPLYSISLKNPFAGYPFLSTNEKVLLLLKQRRSYQICFF